MTAISLETLISGVLLTIARMEVVHVRASILTMGNVFSTPIVVIARIVRGTIKIIIMVVNALNNVLIAMTVPIALAIMRKKETVLNNVSMVANARIVPVLRMKTGTVLNVRIILYVRLVLASIRMRRVVIVHSVRIAMTVRSVLGLTPIIHVQAETAMFLMVVLRVHVRQIIIQMRSTAKRNSWNTRK